MAFALVVRFELRPGCQQPFDALTAQMLQGIRELEEGTLLYVASEVDGSPDSRVFMEVYRNEAAFRQHEAYVHTRRFLEGRQDLIDSFRVEFLNPLDGTLPL